MYRTEHIVFKGKVPCLEKGSRAEMLLRGREALSGGHLGDTSCIRSKNLSRAACTRHTEVSLISQNVQGREVIKHIMTIVFIGKAENAGQVYNRVTSAQGSACRGRDAETES